MNLAGWMNWSVHPMDFVDDFHGAGNFSLDIEPTALASVIESAVESAGLGRGSTFRITLPPQLTERLTRKAPPPAEMGQEAIRPVSAPKLSGLLVLVVDDQADMRDLLSTILRMEEAEVRTADSLDEAMRIITAWRPEIIVSDLAMPCAGGYDLIRRLRDGGCATPAIAITARAGVEDCARSLAAGFQMRLPKPIEPDDLVMSVASLTGRLT